jgi:prolyl 4-hydroxylase
VEIYTHAGVAVNVSMAPGDMVMYESHTCVHGRPAPLQGRFFANVFVHFEPVDDAGHQKNGTGSEAQRGRTGCLCRRQE